MAKKESNKFQNPTKCAEFIEENKHKNAEDFFKKKRCGSQVECLAAWHTLCCFQVFQLLFFSSFRRGGRVYAVNGVMWK